MDKDDTYINPARAALLLQRYFSAEASDEESAELESVAIRYAKSPVPGFPEHLDSDLRLVAALGMLGADADIPERDVPERFERRWNDAVSKTALERRGRLFFGMSRRVFVAAASVAVLLGAAMAWRFASMTDTGLDIQRKGSPTLVIAKASADSKAPAATDDGQSHGNARLQAHSARPAFAQARTTVGAEDDSPTHQPVVADKPNPADAVSVAEENSVEQHSEPVFLPAMASLPAERHNDSYLMASYALDNATSSIADIYDVAEQSMANVAHSLESILDGLGQPDEEDYTERKTLPI